MLERFEIIRNRLLDQVPEICIERAEIFTESYKKYEQYPIIEKRARSLATVLREMSIYIGDEELIVGNQASVPRAAPLFPEYAYEFVLDELDEFEHRESDRFIISEEKKERLKEVLPWWKGRTLKDRATAMQSLEVLEDKKVGVLGWQGNVSSGEGHIIPDYEMIVNLGFSGLLKKVNKLVDGLNLSEPSDLEKLTFYRACKISLEGCIDYINRFKELATGKAEKCSNEIRKKELEDIASRCHMLTERPPASFFEALQCVWFIQVILHIESNGHSLSLGRFDQYLFPFYKKDIDEQIISKEEAHEMLGCFYLKIFGNNKLRSWGTTQTQLGYPTYQNICLGGQTRNGEDATNALTYLCLELLGEIRLPEPNVYIRIHKKTPEEFLLKAIKVVKKGIGMPSFVNDQVIIPSLIRCGVLPDDAINYSTMGCTEVQVPGKWGYRANGKSKINLVRILEIVLNGGIDNKDGKCIIDGLVPLDKCTSIKQIEKAFKKAINYYMKLHIIADNINEMAMNELVPDAFCSLLVQDCLGRGKAIKEGGTVYDIISGTLVGIPNLGNSLFAIKKVVFDKKLMTVSELKKALDNNFEGENGEYIRNLLVNSAEKYGNDNDEVDEYTKKLSDYYVDEIYQYKTLRDGKGPIGCHFTSSTVTITANIPCGASVGATPDGRKAGEPTAEGISPSRGTLKNGITAMFNSVGKLSTELFAGGQLLNVRINPNTIKTEEEEKKFAAILRSAGDLKCWHSQYNVLSNATLLDAQKHPENYTDLIVRVAGYSALFTSLNRELQKDIIERTQFDL
jgi:formate C-acetyltransferase